VGLAAQWYLIVNFSLLSVIELCDGNFIWLRGADAALWRLVFVKASMEAKGMWGKCFICMWLQLD